VLAGVESANYVVCKVALICVTPTSRSEDF